MCVKSALSIETCCVNIALVHLLDPSHCQNQKNFNYPKSKTFKCFLRFLMFFFLSHFLHIFSRNAASCIFLCLLGDHQIGCVATAVIMEPYWYSRVQHHKTYA